MATSSLIDASFDAVIVRERGYANRPAEKGPAGLKPARSAPARR